MSEKIKHILSKDGFHWLIYYTLLATKTARFVPDKWYVKLEYRCLMGKRLDLKHPKTFNEKLQWLKIYDRRPEYTTMVDKYAVKQYVADRIGEQYVIPTLGVWDRPEQIEWDSLPDKFVLKCTHNSGGLVICKDKKKLDKEAAIKKLSDALERDYYLASREWPYKNVPRRIIAEKYMEEAPNIGDLPDYKVFNFNGEPKLIELDYNRFVNHMRNIYTADWELTDIKIDYPSDKDRTFDKPQMLEELKVLCRKLSAGIPFIRSDFYIVDNKLYFGELTFFPDGGITHLQPENYQEILGDWILIPAKENGGAKF